MTILILPAFYFVDVSLHPGATAHTRLNYAQDKISLEDILYRAQRFSALKTCCLFFYIQVSADTHAALKCVSNH